MASADNVIMKIQDLLLYTIPQLAKFPRDQKFLLGDRIQTRLLDVQEHCLRAYYSKTKREHLAEANLSIEITRHLVRLAHTLRFFSNQVYEGVSRRLDEVGRMLGGWIKHAAGGSR